jgi:hypothetical protein
MLTQRKQMESKRVEPSKRNVRDEVYNVMTESLVISLPGKGYRGGTSGATVE